MEEKLNWKKRDDVQSSKLLEQIGDLTKQVVARELSEIHSKIDVLHQMGLIKDDDKVKQLKEKMKMMGLEAEAEVKK